MKVFVKPVNGATLVDPLSNRMVPEGGLRVRIDNYYRRRIADGDAEIVEEKSTSRKPRKPKLEEVYPTDAKTLDTDPDTDKEDS